MLRPAHPRLDGNAAAGALLEAFGRDMSAAGVTCRHCARRGPLAETVAEVDDDGVILLCRSCRHTLLVYVHTDDHRTLSLPGCSELHWRV